MLYWPIIVSFYPDCVHEEPNVSQNAIPGIAGNTWRVFYTYLGDLSYPSSPKKLA